MSELDAIKCWVENAGTEKVSTLIKGQNEAIIGLQKNNDTFVKSYREILNKESTLCTRVERLEAALKEIDDICLGSINIDKKEKGNIESITRRALEGAK